MLPSLPVNCLLQWNNGNIENSEPSAIIEVMNKIWEPRKGRGWSDYKNIEYLTSELNVSWLCGVSVSSHSVDGECTERNLDRENLISTVIKRDFCLQKSW